MVIKIYYVIEALPNAIKDRYEFSVTYGIFGEPTTFQVATINLNFNIEIGLPDISICPTSFVTTFFNIMTSFPSPGPTPAGLAFDGTYLWAAVSGDETIYKLGTSGNIIRSFSSPGPRPAGLAFDGTYLWNADSGDETIYKLDTSGNIIRSFSSPGPMPAGLAFDGTYLWNADSGAAVFGDETIYKLDTSGNIIRSFSSPGRSPKGLAFDGTYLWNAHYYGDYKIYKLDTSGNMIISFPSPGRSPEGLAFDGTYLWNVDRTSDKIYQLEEGAVSVGSSTDQTFTLRNRGVEDLVIGTLEITGTSSTDFSVQDDNCSRRTIEPSGSCTCVVVFSPKSAGIKSADLQIPSNDPDTPTLVVPLSGIASGQGHEPDGDVAPLGNRDGIVNVGDALVCLRFALALETPTQEDMDHGDVAPLDANGQPNPDGQITVGDALVILRKALGIIYF